MLREAKVIGLYRGEAHGRLALRFCCIGESLQVRHAHIGHLRHGGTGALAIIAGTRAISQRVATKNVGGPPQVCGDPQFAPVQFVDKELFDHTRHAIHVNEVGSAQDKVNSVRDVKGAC